MSDEKIDLNNLNIMDVWEFLEMFGLDKILGLTLDEYIFLSKLPSTMSEEEITAQLAIYRNYKSQKQQNQGEK